MTDHSAALTALSLAVLDSEAEHAALLRSIVRTAQAIFGATASSILMLDRDTGELVLEAVAREGEEWLVGHRFPASAGIAGWVVTAAEPVVVDDLSASTMFARDVAEGTGYVPSAMMAAPVIYGGEVLGVLEVMDYAPTADGALDAARLLELFADQAAVALTVVLRARSARRILVDGTQEYAGVLPVVEGLLRLEPDQRAAGIGLLGSVAEMLRAGA
jgi:GAF domain-containing protein